MDEYVSKDSQALMAYLEGYKDPVFGTYEEFHPLMLAAKANEEDNPTFEQAVNGENSEAFWDAMRKELKTLEDMNV